MTARLLAIVLVVLLSSQARAQSEAEKQACVAAFDAAQQHRAEQRLLQAREELLQCGQPSCPDVVRSKCMEWLPDLERALPSIVVAVKDRRGEDAVVADVRIDGTLVSRRIDGRPIVIDPGPHTLRIDLRGSPPKTADGEIGRWGIGGSILPITLSPHLPIVTSWGRSSPSARCTSQARRAFSRWSSTA